MPLYEVSHCVPLSREQKDAIAEFITNLHATTFVTPMLFVNVKFEQPAPVSGIYSGGKLRGQTIPNHIRASVRTGPTRPKEKYDEVGLKIQKHWNEVVEDKALGAQSFEHLSEKERRDLKMLHGVVFYPFVAAVEEGLVVPSPGDEGTWMKDNIAYFKELAAHGNVDVQEMLKEVSTREDMKSFL